MPKTDTNEWNYERASSLSFESFIKEMQSKKVSWNPNTTKLFSQNQIDSYGSIIIVKLLWLPLSIQSHLMNVYLSGNWKKHITQNENAFLVSCSKHCEINTSEIYIANVLLGVVPIYQDNLYIIYICIAPGWPSLDWAGRVCAARRIELSLSLVAPLLFICFQKVVIYCFTSWYSSLNFTDSGMHTTHE